MKIQFLVALSAAFLLSACGVGQEPPAADELGTESAELKTCKAIALCVQGYHWNDKTCRCVENKTCGGIAAFPCAEGKVCVDDSKDSCDPAAGGADCPGVCQPAGDCRSTGCPRGDYCTFCWFNYACIPDGAVC